MKTRDKQNILSIIIVISILAIIIILMYAMFPEESTTQKISNQTESVQKT